MKHQYSDETYNLRIELDTKNCDLQPAEIAKMEEAISLLREPVKDGAATLRQRISVADTQKLNKMAPNRGSAAPQKGMRDARG